METAYSIYDETRLTDADELLALKVSRAYAAFNNALQNCARLDDEAKVRIQAQVQQLGKVLSLKFEEPFQIKPLISGIETILKQSGIVNGAYKPVEKRKQALLRAYANRLEKGSVPCGMLPIQAIEMAEEFSGRKC